MPKSRQRKKHKTKIIIRKQRLQEQKNKIKKFQDGFLEQMLKEKKEGAFDEENLLELPDAEHKINDSVKEDSDSDDLKI